VYLATQEKKVRSGVAGNARLTGLVAAVLLLMLAAEGATIPFIGTLLTPHILIGIALIPPVLLKLGSTGYRFVRYYSANPSYRRKGPPALPLRLIAPILVLSTLVVLASGVALLLAGPSSRSALLPIHKIGFIVWGAFFAVHLLAHLPAMVRDLGAEYGPARAGGSAWQRHMEHRDGVSGRAGRALSLLSALTFGLVLALVLIPQFGPWLSAQHVHH